MIRIGLIGSGYMGSQHAAAYAAMKDVRVVAVAGRGTESAGRLGAVLGARVYADWRAVLDDRQVDAVDVTFPTALHREVAEAALDAGKHVFCETPLAPTPEDAEAMIRSAKRSGRLLQVALLSRFDGSRTRVRAAVLAGTLGRLHAIHARRLAPGTSGAHHGDAIEEIMLFDLDACQWILGLPRRVSAGATRGPTGRIDHATALLGYDGVTACVEASYLLPREHPFVTAFDAFGELGCLETTFEAPRAGPPNQRVRLHLRGAEPVVDTALCDEPVAAECRHFVRVVKGDETPELLDAEEARRALSIASAIRTSIRTGATVLLGAERVDERGQDSAPR